MNDLYERSGAGAYGISRECFVELLDAVCQRCQAGKSPAELRKIAESLRLDDLTLAWGCALGSETAWERFIGLYREKLFRFALSLTHERVAARDLAESIYADLFATRLTSSTPGASRFEAYSGRGSLEGWLRAVLAREYSNRFRARRLLVSYEEELEGGRQFGASQTSEAGDPRLEKALEIALAALDAGDRFLLASYYLDGRTLAAVAAALSVHESTVSRRLSKLLRRLRTQVREKLKRDGCDLDRALDKIELDLQRSLKNYGPERA